jgi:AcrR family transcriptional regulator
LRATIDSLAEIGFAGTSTVVIQKRAGVSRGRLLHQFGSRDELLVAAVRHLASEWFNELSEHADLTEVGKDRIGLAIRRLWITNDSPLFWAAMELWLGSRNDPELTRAIARSEKTIGSLIKNYCDALFGAEICAHPAYIPTREILLTSMRGVALTYAFSDRDMKQDPHLDDWAEFVAARLGLS